MFGLSLSILMKLNNFWYSYESIEYFDIWSENKIIRHNNIKFERLLNMLLHRANTSKWPRNAIGNSGIFRCCVEDGPQSENLSIIVFRTNTAFGNKS